MFISIKTKIWLTILSIVLMFTFFTLYYFPKQQAAFLLKDYNNEVQSFANTVALGVRIALDEQDYKGVQTAMEYVKSNPGLSFVSLVQYDTSWDSNHRTYTIRETPFETVNKTDSLQKNTTSQDSVIIKKAPFNTSFMSGVIVLGFNTSEINQSINEVRITSLIVSGIICVLGIIIGLWLSRSISLPVIALRNAALKVGEGDFTSEVKKSSSDEIGDLAKAFNKMVRDLLKAREELNTTNTTLTTTNATLTNTLNDLKATQSQLIQSEKMASLGELTAGIAHEIQNPLNFVNNFAELNAELIDELNSELTAGNTEDVEALSQSIKENNVKITFHGKRADAIVKGMLQHSRKSTGQKELTDINMLADEFLRLSYHGLRAKDKAFNATLQTNFDANVGKLNVVAQDVGRVLLNLFNNAFYAIAEKKRSGLQNYEPTVKLSTKKINGAVEIRVSDNGFGIPKQVSEKIFQPFFTTKPTGHGTGLGLSISYDIITKEHNGNLRVETVENEGAEFIITLPLQ